MIVGLIHMLAGEFSNKPMHDFSLNRKKLSEHGAVARVRRHAVNSAVSLAQETAWCRPGRRGLRAPPLAPLRTTRVLSARADVTYWHMLHPVSDAALLY